MAGYKINIQKWTAFLYAGTNASKPVVVLKLYFLVAIETKRYLRINLTKDLQDLHGENYETLLDISKTSIYVKDISCMGRKTEYHKYANSSQINL